MKCLSSMDYLSISISANTSRQKMVFEIVSSMVETHSPKKIKIVHDYRVALECLLAVEDVRFFEELLDLLFRLPSSASRTCLVGCKHFCYDETQLARRTR